MAPGDAFSDWVEQHLDHLRHEKRLSPRTLALHAFELQRLRSLLDDRKLTLTQVDAHWRVRPWRVCTARGFRPKAWP